MKALVLIALAACSGGWKQTSASEPEPDSRTEYTAPPVQTTARVATKKTCLAAPHAARASVTIVVANASTYSHDLCLATDQSLGLLPNVTGIAGFQLDVTLTELKQTGVHVKCSISVGVRVASGARIGVFDQAVTAQASSLKAADLESSRRDCVDANIDDLVRQRAVPAMQRHAHSTPSSP